MNLTNEIPVRSKPRLIRWSWPADWRRPWEHSAHLLLIAAALMVAALIILVPAYLVMRMAGAGRETFDLLVRASTLQTLLRWWLDNELPYSPERMNKMFMQLVMGGIGAVVQDG